MHVAHFISWKTSACVSDRNVKNWRQYISATHKVIATLSEGYKSPTLATTILLLYYRKEGVSSHEQTDQQQVQAMKRTL